MRLELMQALHNGQLGGEGGGHRGLFGSPEFTGVDWGQWLATAFSLRTVSMVNLGLMRFLCLSKKRCREMVCSMIVLIVLVNSLNNEYN